ncbi:MAG: hypothetical protein GXO89_07460 [Chlorobi bacterium]|nr:hypothetical protein [Chlorobiota bacterium]
MEEGFNNIDDLLRNSLDDYQAQPSAKVWKAVSRSLFFSGMGKIIILISGIAVLSVAAYLYWGYSNVGETSGSNVEATEIGRTQNEDMASSETAVEGQNQTLGKEEGIYYENAGLSENDVTTNNNNLSGKPDHDFGSPQVEDVPLAEISTTDKTGEVNDVIVTTMVSASVASNVTIQTNTSQKVYPGLPRLSEESPMERMAIKTLDANYLFYQYNPIGNINERTQFKGLSGFPDHDYGRAKLFSYGVYVSPEVIFMNDEAKTRKLQLNFDAVTNYKPTKDFYLQGGLGIGVSQDDGRYNVDYEQYDSVGYYLEVNSYTIDPVTGKPVFKTSIENVYDTVAYNKLSLTGNRYTYLRLSGFMGYRVHYAKSFSVFVKGGLTYSILVNSYEPNPEFSNGDALNLKITKETAQRINDTWQASVGVGFNCRLSNSVTLTGEPMFNYYLRPVYERGYNAKNPYSLGLKLGLLFKF